jgi:hypothetical protein
MSTAGAWRGRASIERAPRGRDGDRKSEVDPDVNLPPPAPAVAAQHLVAGPEPAGRGYGPTRAASIQGLQRQYGNRAVQRLIQRAISPQTAPAEDDLAAGIDAAGPGESLPAGAQRTLERGLGAGVSGLRVHTGAEADRLTHSVDAVAFTTGSDTYFRAGAYAPETAEGLRLLAHEAAHVVQQSTGPVSGTAGSGGVAISEPDDPFEQEADRAAEEIAAPPAPVAPLAVQRRDDAPREEVSR